MNQADGSRLEDFRQFRKEIRGSKEYLLIGIDVAKDKHHPFRFENGRQVLKMAGLDLSAERSGKASEGAVPVISKKGKADLRYALYRAAFLASTRNAEFIAYYTNQLRGREREPGIKTKMRVKLSAKLLIIGWTLMKKKEAFHPNFLKLE